MKNRFKSFMLFPVALVSLTVSVSGQVIRADFKETIEKVTLAAYQSATAGFPCKIRTAFKPKIMRVADVDGCLNTANDRIDWEGLAQQIKAIQENERIPWMDVEAALETSFAAHSIPFEKVFMLKDEKVLMPLSNSLLKFLPPSSLQDLAVFAKNGTKVGTFAGVYSYEKAGELAAANTYKLTVFQYSDSKGNLQTPASANKLLRDNYGVLWSEVMSQPGFRLSPEKLLPKRR
jgi:hypothetical protein